MDQDRKLRAVFEPVTFAELVCSAVAAIARHGTSDDLLVARLLDVMERCSRGALPLNRKTIMRLHDAIRVESAASFADVMKATQPAPS